jgi:uncharacterized protein (DUF2126 family)
MIRVALNHKSSYRYDRPVELGPQVVRLRPAPHCRTPISSYSLQVAPEKHFLNWQQDPHSNYLARLIFPENTRSFEVQVDLIAEMTVINPFDFFLEPSATKYPFDYEPVLKKDLEPFLVPLPAGSKLSALVDSIDRSSTKTNDFLVDLNQQLERRINYVIRFEPGVQTPEETLSLASGSCRDSAWLLVQVLRHLGLASRFVSGYLIQLKPDVDSLDGPSGPTEDFTDLHAWAEVFLPGAGWIGLDPTSGLFSGEGHIPVACTPEPITAAPISGSVDECEVEFKHEMSVTRIHEDPRVTKPYTDEQWQQIDAVGNQVDARLEVGSVRLTMGGEPTFVSIDDMDGDEWKTAAVGPTKRQLAGDLIHRLRERFAPGGVMHYGQGKWYPGESLPRWALTCMWRTDGQPIWKKTCLLADPDREYGHKIEESQRFSSALASRLNVHPDHVLLAYEDVLYYLWKEQRLLVNADARHVELEDQEERARLARILERGLGAPVGCVFPLVHQWWNAKPRWMSGTWPVRADHMFLIPGDSPMGLRLPLDGLPPATSSEWIPSPVVPFEEQASLPEYEKLSRQYAGAQRVQQRVLQAIGSDRGGTDNGYRDESIHEQTVTTPVAVFETGIVRTAMCIEPRDGKLHVFMPPTSHLEAYLELLTAIEETAEELDVPVVIEGYLPPPDYRLQQIKVTPDPGVIEVNVHPANNWQQLTNITSGVYEDARRSRLGTEKFELDGTHTGTGGGNHIVMGAQTPADSPFLRRPDLLRSLIAYWHNHPALSYLFSGRFIGPTSQAPRVDEGRRDGAYELQIAFEQIPANGDCPPWLVDRVFRHLLVDLTGNTHRAEFCVDKLYSPDSATGRLGLIEFRAFEMPPHWQMSLTQQLLLRALVAYFWEQPYNAKLTDWNTSIHDRWMLPHFVWQDFEDVIGELNEAGLSLDAKWFAPHFEFRFPFMGQIHRQGIDIELRTAIEPWYVLGEEPAGGQTARYVDSSVERLQVKVRGMSDERNVITCNGRKVPLHPTGVRGEFVAGVRYRAWQPPNCLHPTIPVDEPLVFDVLDTWLGRSIGGCQYHVGHAGGRNPGTFPVNAYEAESRRAGRFFKIGHTAGRMTVPEDENNMAFPMTLDLRRNRVVV